MHPLDIVALAICLIVAICVWLYVVNSNRAITEKTIVLTINAEDQIEYAKDGFSLYGNNQTDYSQLTVELTVSGTKEALERYEDSEYSVSLDLPENITAGGNYLITLLAKMPGDDVSLKSMSPSYISTLIDESSTREISLKVDTIGGLSAGLSVANLTTKVEGSVSDKISVSGPKTIIDMIDQALVKVDITGFQKSVLNSNKISNYEFLDSNGKNIDSTGKYISYIEFDSEIRVDIQINFDSKTVPLTVSYFSEDGAYSYDCKAFFTEDSSDTVAMIALTGNTDAFYEYLTDNFNIAYKVSDPFDENSNTLTKIIKVSDLNEVLRNIVKAKELADNNGVEADESAYDVFSINTDANKEITITIVRTPLQSEMPSTPGETENP
jgi:hypothetical protein